MNTPPGVRAGDFHLAVLGDHNARDRVTFGYYVWPHFVRWLKRVKLLGETDPRDLIPTPPGPVSVEALGFLMIRPLYGDPDPQPNLVASRVALLERAIGSLPDLEELLQAELKTARGIAERH